MSTMRHKSRRWALSDDGLKATVEDFRTDEAAHRNTALAEGAEQAPGYRLPESRRSRPGAGRRSNCRRRFERVILLASTGSQSRVLRNTQKPAS